MPTEPTLADSTILDLTQLRTMTGGDVEMQKTLMQIFVEESDKNIDSLARAQGAGPGSPWAEAAHMLKGGAGSIGAENLRVLANEAQRFSGDVEAQARLLEKIKAAYALVKAALRAEALIDA